MWTKRLACEKMMSHVNWAFSQVVGLNEDFLLWNLHFLHQYAIGFFFSHIDNNFHMSKTKHDTWDLVKLTSSHVNSTFIIMGQLIFFTNEKLFPVVEFTFSNVNTDSCVICFFHPGIRTSTCTNKTWHMKTHEICHLPCKFHITQFHIWTKKNMWK